MSLLFGFGQQGPCRLVDYSCGCGPFGAFSWALGSKCREQRLVFRSVCSAFLCFLSFLFISCFFSAAARVAFLDCAVESEVVDFLSLGSYGFSYV